MKKGNSPLIVAVFLVIGGLLSGVSIFNNRTGAIKIVPSQKDAEFFISTAQGAENAAVLFGARTLSPVTAVSDNSASDPRLTLFIDRGAIKDPGNIGLNSEKMGKNQETVQNSSLSR